MSRETRKQELKDSSSYNALIKIAEVMDRYYLDPLLGLIPGGWGDFITSVLVLPFIYVAAVKLKSFTLTLAIIYNLTKDCLLGLLPFFIGDIVDFFNRSYKENLRLVTGFVENDKEVVRTVNANAIKFALLIVVFCILIYFMIKLLVLLGGWLITSLGGK